MTISAKTRPSFGEELRRLRKRANLTQKQLSELTGISLQSLSALENDKFLPRFDTFETIIDVLAKQLDMAPNKLILDESFQSEPFRRARELLLTVSSGLFLLSQRLRDRLPKVGRLIRQAREQQGLSHRQLAEKCGISYTRISKLERGIFSGWSLKQVMQVAEALGITDEVENALLE